MINSSLNRKESSKLGEIKNGLELQAYLDIHRNNSKFVVEVADCDISITNEWNMDKMAMVRLNKAEIVVIWFDNKDINTKRKYKTRAVLIAIKNK